jgi:hypothetical protein
MHIKSVFTVNLFLKIQVAGHELKSSQQVFNCQLEDLNLSMIAIVDYRGFRLIAQSRLPIAGDATLVSL